MKRPGKHKEQADDYSQAYYAGRDAFFKAALEAASRHFKLDGVSFYEYDEKTSLLRLRLRLLRGVVFEHEENSMPEAPSISAGVRLRRTDSTAMEALKTLQPVSFKGPTGYFAAIPFKLDYSGASLQNSPAVFTGFVRLERYARKKRFSRPECGAAMAYIGEFLRNYYKAEFFSLNKKHSKNIEAITELTEVFAGSLRVRDSCRHILAGIQTYFGFDRVRLYLIDEKNKKLKGELSADIRGQIKSIAYEEIPLEPGAHRFADIMLGRDSGAFMERYKDCVLYLPLAVQGAAIGLLIVDNLLSQQRIAQEDLVLLKSFAGQIGLAVDNVRLFDKVEELSLYDELTRLPLRRYFNQRFQEEFYRAERFKQPLALIWGDIDYFKEINDTYGHQIGDYALKEMGRVILSNLRKIDFPCRYGGDEVIIMLPQATGVEAMKFAQRLLEELSEVRIPVPFSKTHELKISMSFGVSTFPRDAATQEKLLEKADDALYWVKSHSRGSAALYAQVIADSAGETAGRGKGEKSEDRSQKSDCFLTSDLRPLTSKLPQPLPAVDGQASGTAADSTAPEAQKKNADPGEKYNVNN